MIAFRNYVVTNKDNGNAYNVVFTFERGIRKGTCDCAAGQKGMVCKHLSIAAGVHTAIAAQRNA
jgi:uncharacterized Zn finger protein